MISIAGQLGKYESIAQTEEHVLHSRTDGCFICKLRRITGFVARWGRFSQGCSLYAREAVLAGLCVRLYVGQAVRFTGEKAAQ
jgi:hypothetical protein